MARQKAVAPYDAGQFFQLLRDGTPRTRAELATLTGLSRPTVAARIDELLALDLISPVSDSTSTGGRPSARIAFNPGSRAVAAVDVGATHARVAICDLSGTILIQKQDPLRVVEGPEVILDWVVATVRELLLQIKRDERELVAVGVGLPGPVNHATGRPSNPPIMPGWHDYDVPGRIQQTYDVPVLVDNDVNIMALGERAACWPEVTDMIFVKVATGIGSGIISDGELRRGANGAAGDVGHLYVTRAAGLTCRCGRTGCLEAFAGAPASVTSMADEGIEAHTASDIVQLVRDGNLTAARIVREAGRAIGEMLNTCISIVNPSLIVIGGTLAQSGENLLAGIREEVYRNSFPLTTQDLSIVPSRVGQQAGVIGAALLAIEHVLDPAYLLELPTCATEATS